MKFFRLFIFFLLSVIIIIAVMTFMLPTTQKISRSTIIKAPAASIYNYIEKLENFNNWAVWTLEDSSATYTLTGTDGKVGAVTEWKGHPEISGEGKIEIVTLEKDRKIVQHFYFIKPKKIDATSTMLLNETEKSTTTVTWDFSIATPRPWNIFNLFSSIDKQIGKDFEDGLSNLKTIIEKNQPITQ
ncbi:hypothetical protein CAP36_07680 [Chitinophagaceae bacterium IBVUCB2]|nr:hypothetical protein CAP36_07680 [Chitinophagaceae bacterium IBVUCB2]